MVFNEAGFTVFDYSEVVIIVIIATVHRTRESVGYLEA
jgi:hypothetical protein